MFKFLSLLLMLYLLAAASAHARLGSIDMVGKQATSISKKRVELNKWDGQPNSTISRKTFPIKEWGKHYSSLGGKRSNLGARKIKKRKIYETKTKEYPVKQLELARWNDRIANLQKRAQVATDDRVKDIEERRIYGVMLQNAQPYGDMRETLSLRDINRYQFRRNRQADGVPVQKAAAGDSY